MRVVRMVAVGLLAAVAAGALMGSLARFMMRVASLSAEHSSEFSVAGTLSILAIFAVLSTPGAVLASVWRGRGRSLLLIAGAVFLCVPATGVAQADLGHLGSLSILQWAGVGVGTAGVYVAILAMPWVALRVIAVADRGSSPDKTFLTSSPQAASTLTTP